MAIVRCAANVSAIVMKWKYINAATKQAAINDAFGEKAALMARTAMARRFGTCVREAGAESAVVFIPCNVLAFRQKNGCHIPFAKTSHGFPLRRVKKIVRIWQPYS